jgi:hypothetical protein
VAAEAKSSKFERKEQTAIWLRRSLATASAWDRTGALIFRDVSSAL